GFVVAVLAEVQPRHFPVGIGSAASIRKTLLQFPIGIDGLIVIAPQKIHVALREQRLLKPRARRSGLPQLRKRSLEAGVVIGSAGDLSELIQALRIYFARSLGQR